MAKPKQQPQARAMDPMSKPANRRDTWRNLVRMMLEARTPALDQDILHRRQAELQDRFVRIDAELAEAQARRDRALARLPADRRDGWLSAVITAIAITLGDQRGRSTILPEDQTLPFPRAANGVFLHPELPATTRAASAIARASSPEGRIKLVLDDTGAQPRVLLTILPLAPDAAPPVLLAIPANQAQSPVEIDAEIIPDPAGLRLRYEASLPPGTYDLVLGHPRERHHDTAL